MSKKESFSEYNRNRILYNVGEHGGYDIGLGIITKTCPCNIQKMFLVVKMKIFPGKNLVLFLFLLKTEIVGTS